MLIDNQGHGHFVTRTTYQKDRKSSPTESTIKSNVISEANFFFSLRCPLKFTTRTISEKKENNYNRYDSP